MPSCQRRLLQRIPRKIRYFPVPRASNRAGRMVYKNALIMPDHLMIRNVQKKRSFIPVIYAVVPAPIFRMIGSILGLTPLSAVSSLSLLSLCLP
jgi:hypothetical protein